ncbi:MAG: YajD family HNH nuclease [Desulfatitalea sp.]|jgi:hypothetical protein|nr:YajD family HNH nuclease [Desulfatitalea sp.]
MAPTKTPSDSDRLRQIVAEARQHRKSQENTYRERALKLFPKICARCGREFEGKRLKELTVHHKDHNHDHNPPDGSNWELLCLYCHDNEHSRQEVADAYAPDSPDRESRAGLGDNPFAALGALLKGKE